MAGPRLPRRPVPGVRVPGVPGASTGPTRRGAAIVPLAVVAGCIALVAVLVLAQPYPLDDGRGGNGLSGAQAPDGTWTGGTIPDERSFLGWAQIHWETGRLWLPASEASTGVAQAAVRVGADAQDSRVATIALERPGGQAPAPEGGPRPGGPGGAPGGDAPAPDGARQRPVAVLSVRDGNGAPVAGEQAEVVGVPGAPPGRTDAQGIARIGVVPGASFRVAGVELRVPEGPPVRVQPSAAADGLRLRIEPVGGGGLTVGGEAMDGPASVTLPWGRGGVLVQAGGVGHAVPQVSTRVTVDGEPGFANHWPAAQSLLLVPFYLTGTTWLATLGPFAVGTWAVVWLGRRYAGPWGGGVAGIAFATSGVVVMVAYNRLMADLPSACYLAAGLALVVAAADRVAPPAPAGASSAAPPRAGWPGTLALSAAAGALLGLAVLLRLTSVLALGAPLAVLACRALRSRADAPALGRLAAATVPALVLLAVLGSWLLWYNASLFGDPLATGYGDTSGAGRSIDLATDDWTHFWGVIAPRLLVLAPVLALGPLALAHARRSPEPVLLAAAWGIPVAFYYAQLGWVGRIGWEDMRYFLPAVPAAALGLAVATRRAVAHSAARWLLAGAGATSLAAGLWSGWLGMAFQVGRYARQPIGDAIPAGLTALAVATIVLAAGAVAWAALAASSVRRGAAAAAPAPTAAAAAGGPRPAATPARPPGPVTVGPRTPPGPAARTPPLPPSGHVRPPVAGPPASTPQPPPSSPRPPAPRPPPGAPGPGAHRTR